MGRKGSSGMGASAGGSAPLGTFVELTSGTFVADFGNGVTAMVGLVGDSGKWTASVKQDGKDQFVKDFESKQAAMTFVKNNAGSTTTPIPKKNVSVSTSGYQFAHGKMPSGNGSWAFEIGSETKFFSGKFSDAKKQAIGYAASKGISSVKVGS